MVSQFSANKLGNQKIRESEETEPQMFTRYVKSDRPGNKELPADGLTQWHPRGRPRSDLATWCDSGSGPPLIGLPQRAAARAANPSFGDPELVEQMTRDAALGDHDCGPKLLRRQAQGCCAMP